MIGGGPHNPSRVIQVKVDVERLKRFDALVAKRLGPEKRSEAVREAIDAWITRYEWRYRKEMDRRES